MPLAFVVFVLCAVGLEFGLRKTRFGLRLRAVGSDEESARRVGVPVNRTALLGYLGASLLTLLGAIVLLAQLGVGDPGQGTGYTLTSITAVVLGGTSLLGGRGTFIGTLMGAGLSVQVLNATVFLGLDQKWQYIFQGLLIVAAALIYSQVRAAGARTAAELRARSSWIQSTSIRRPDPADVHQDDPVAEPHPDDAGFLDDGRLGASADKRPEACGGPVADDRRRDPGRIVAARPPAPRDPSPTRAQPSRARAAGSSSRRARSRRSRRARCSPPCARCTRSCRSSESPSTRCSSTRRRRSSDGASAVVSESSPAAAGPGLAVQRAGRTTCHHPQLGRDVGAADVLGGRGRRVHRGDVRARRRVRPRRHARSPQRPRVRIRPPAGRCASSSDSTSSSSAPGDSITFPSSTPHRLSNDGHVTARAIWVVRGRRGTLRTRTCRRWHSRMTEHDLGGGRRAGESDTFAVRKIHAAAERSAR